MSLLEQLKALLESAKDDKEVKGYLKELKQFSADDVKKYLDSDEGKKFHQPILDAYFTKGHKTWEDKNLEKIKAEAVAASKNETPEAKEIRELKENLANETKARKQEAIKNKAIASLTSKSLPVELAEIISTANDDDGLNSHLALVEKAFSDYSNKLNADFQAQNGRKVVVAGGTKLTKDVLKTLTPEQILQFPQEEIDAILKQG
jgi:hypothetical protein